MTEAEEKIVHLKSVDFYSNLNWLSLHRLKLRRVKLPQESGAAQMTRQKLRYLQK